MARSKDGTLYVALSECHVIGRLSKELQLTLVAGKEGERGYQDGDSQEARFHHPW